MKRFKLVHLGAATALIIANVIWGANFVVAKQTLEQFPVMSLAFLRFFLSCILLLPFIISERHQIKLKWKDLPRFFLVGLMMITFHIFLFYEGINRTLAINASILSMTAPILSVIVGWWFLKEKIFLVNLIGIILGFLGTLTIIGLPLFLTGNFAYLTVYGDMLIILSSIVFVTGAACARSLLQKYPPFTVTIVSFCIGAITFLVPAIVEYLQTPQWVDNVTITGWLGLLYIIVLSSISAFFMYEWGLHHLGLMKADLFNYLQPVVAALFAFTFLHERISFSFVLGTCLIILGVYWGTLGKKHIKALHHHRSHGL